MMALLALLAMSAANPARATVRSFICTPRTLESQTLTFRCEEGFSLRLWGIKPVRENLRLKQTLAALQSLVNAQAAHVASNGSIEFTAAYAMRCYSTDQRGATASQCFVRSKLVFGDEDLACSLVGARLAKPARYYSSCLRFRPA